MLAACCEAEPGEEALVALGRESQARWPGFAEELLARERHRCGIARRGHAAAGAHGRRSGEIAHRLEFQRQPRSTARMAFGRAIRAGASRVLQAKSPARCSRRKTIRSTTASSRWRCVSPPRPRARNRRASAGQRNRRARRPRDGVVLEDGMIDHGRCRRARRRRLVAHHRRAAAGSAAAGASGQGPNAVAAHGCGGAALSITCCGRRVFTWCRASTAGSLSAARSRKKALTIRSRPAAC